MIKIGKQTREKSQVSDNFTADCKNENKTEGLILSETKKLLDNIKRRISEKYLVKDQIHLEETFKHFLWIIFWNVMKT